MGSLEQQKFYTFFEKAGKIIVSKVPNCEYMVDEHYDYGWGALGISFRCPCGELSRMAVRYDDLSGETPTELAECMIKRLRDHVRSEGNEPNF